MPWRQEPVVADLDEAFGQDVKQKATDEGLGADGGPATMFGGECHLSVPELDDPGVGDGDAVGIATEVGEVFYEEGYTSEETRVRYLEDLRYRGQRYELTVPVGAGPMDLAQLADDFNAEHQRTYGHSNKEYPVKLVNIRAICAEVDRSKDLDSRAFLVSWGDGKRA